MSLALNLARLQQGKYKTTPFWGYITPFRGIDLFALLAHTCWMDIGDKVKVRLPGGSTLRGAIVSRVYTANTWNPAGEFQYGITVGSDRGNVKYYLESDLILDEHEVGKCTCGAEAVSSVHHSDYCDKVLK